MTTETILRLGVFFGTCADQPALGLEGMTVGQAQCQDEGPARLGWSLAFPFRK